MSTPNPQSSVDGASTTLDLHDIALLLNYERVSTEPRFRYTKLQETSLRVASSRLSELQIPAGTKHAFRELAWCLHAWIIPRRPRPARNPTCRRICS
ncbi:hypothetical protein BDN70DRAFT_248375 [Pholiota conissans]|uniref:Uncharacterized protein n=1 Tax=Pholiota conissans TaxID=109636 RepID=A0A9P5YTH8_9AGAR|nr:hypothetical protein BDN70DRAFT_248375 [Pholiota conissans]